MSRIREDIEQQMELVRTGVASEKQATTTMLARHSLGEILLNGGNIEFLGMLVKDKTVAGEILGNVEFEPMILRALNARDERLPHVALTALEVTGQFRPEMLRLVTSTSTGVSDRAAKLLAKLLDRPLLSQLDAGLQRMLAEESETVQVRILALLIESGRANPELLEDLAARGYVEKILATFLTDDILLKLNGTVLIEALGSFPAGAALLKRDARIAAAVAEELEHPLDEATENSVLLVMANLGLVATAPVFWRKLEEFLAAKTPERVLVALRAMAAVARHADLSVRDIIKTREAALKSKIIKTLTAANVEVVKTSLDTWEALVLVWSRDTLAEVAEIADKIFVSKPFPDVRSLSWALFTTLLSVGIPVHSDSNVVKLLKDFSSEESYDARLAKWGFVRAFVTRKEAKSLVDEELWSLLTTYAQEGLAYAPTKVKEPSVERVTG